MKNRKLFLLYAFLVLVIIIIVLTVISINTKKTTETTQVLTPTPVSIGSSQQKQVNQLQPGKSTIQDVKTIYGNPVTVSQKNGYNENDYSLPNTWMTDKVFTKNNIVQYISQQQLTNNSSYSEFIKQTNKQPDGTLYDPQGYGGINKWYVFSNEGVAFYINPQTGYTYQTIKFQPMSYQNFLKDAPSLFSLTQQEPDQVKVDGANPQNQ